MSDQNRASLRTQGVFYFHDEDAIRFCSRNYFFSFFGVHPKGLLAQHVLTIIDDNQALSVVEGVRGSNIDNNDFRVRTHGVIRLVDIDCGGIDRWKVLVDKIFRFCP